MGKPKVSVVQYLNTVPLIWGMLAGEQRDQYELDFTTPACCAETVKNGFAALGIIPSIEVQRIPGLQVLSGISIASKAVVKSVLLLSNVPIEQIRTIALDNSSRTSAALVQVLSKKFYGIAPRFIAAAPNSKEMLRHADAALLIGDPALALREGGTTVYDLAAEWRKFTGLPFVFAVWAGSARFKPAAYRQDFQNSRDYGLAHVEEIAAQCASRCQMSAEAVKKYLTENINYTLDEENQEGLAHFYRLAYEQGLIPANRTIEYV